MSHARLASCYRYKGFLIPGCWAVALNTGACTCGVARKSYEEVVDGKLAKMAKKIDDISREVERLSTRPR